MATVNTAYLLLGSNLGERENFLSKAIDMIKKNTGKIISRSSLYETAPWGNKNQSNFINQVICIETDQSPEELLSAILEIEKKMGRERDQKWEARIIDIDILFFNSEIIRTPSLSIPHPFLHERRFTLVPLEEISAGYIHPVLHKTIAQLLADCKDDLQVLPLSKAQS